MSENREYVSRSDELGNIHISEEVLAAITAAAALEVEGVSAMMGGSVGGKKMSAKGVRVEMDGDGIVVNLFIVVRYGSAIGDVAKKVQQMVRTALEGMTGFRVAAVYVLVGLVLAVMGGTIIEKLHMERYVEDFILSAGGVDLEAPSLTRRDRLMYAREQMTGTFRKVFPYILVGVGIGAVIHNWIPQDYVEAVLGGGNPFGVVLATLVGVPMYADIFGTIPVAEALLSKGAQLGTVLSFMMAVTTLSLPSMIMLRKAVKPRLLALFIAICTVGIILVGYLFNVLQPLLV